MVASLGLISLEEAQTPDITNTYNILSKTWLFSPLQILISKSELSFSKNVPFFSAWVVALWGDITIASHC